VPGVLRSCREPTTLAAWAGMESMAASVTPNMTFLDMFLLVRRLQRADQFEPLRSKYRARLVPNQISTFWAKVLVARPATLKARSGLVRP
jgi:hypothetical protein